MTKNLASLISPFENSEGDSLSTPTKNPYESEERSPIRIIQEIETLYRKYLEKGI